MTDLYLSFADEAEAESHLYDSVELDGATILVPRYVNTDVLGVIYDLDVTDPENPVATPLSGWHVNVRTDEYDPALEAFRVYPATPRRVWA